MSIDKSRCASDATSRVRAITAATNQDTQPDGTLLSSIVAAITDAVLDEIVNNAEVNGGLCPIGAICPFTTIVHVTGTIESAQVT